MRADEIANGFNGVTERQYWRASLAGSRTNPEVHFNSRASMVRVAYRINSGDFTVSFTRASASFGDFLASAYRSLEQVHAALKAAALPFEVLAGQTALRVQYDPKTKDVSAWIAGTDDLWMNSDPEVFKVPQRKTLAEYELEIDAAEASE